MPAWNAEVHPELDRLRLGDDIRQLEHQRAIEKRIGLIARAGQGVRCEHDGNGEFDTPERVPVFALDIDWLAGDDGLEALRVEVIAFVNRVVPYPCGSLI